MQVEVKDSVIEYVSPDTLKFAPFNPPSRTEKRALTKLRADAEKRGRIVVPILITKDDFVADGHRRLTVARELGFERVPVIREDDTLASLWGMNGTQSPTTRKTWMQAVREGYPLEYVPDEERALISDLIRVAGKKLFDQLADNHRSPYIGKTARFVAGYCSDTSDKFVKRVILWFEECGTQNAARDAISAKCPADVLLSAINDMRQIRQYWGIA